MPRKSEKSSVFGTACAFSNGRVTRRALFCGRSRRLWPSENVMQLDYVRREIERMRTQVHRQRGEIRQLQRGEFQPPQPKRSWKEWSTRSTSCVPIGTGSRKSRGLPPREGSWVGGHGDPAPQWYDEKDDHSPWIKALAEVRIRATRE